MNKNVLLTDNLTKQYKAGKVIFKDVNMTFKPGEIVGLIGPNGSGKTTFLRLLSVTSFPTSGSVKYGGINIHKSPYEYLRHVGLVHDEESLPLHLSAVELLEWILRSRKLWDDKSPELIHSFFDKFRLQEERNDPIGTYSTGMKKKAQIAAAVISKPDILILDEPLRGLDVKTRETTIELLRNKRNEGAIILMASHTMPDSDQFFDRIMEFPLKD
jgi:ABC-type multidrug transport system ATPase subunit